jgi:hypothetical protein
MKQMVDTVTENPGILTKELKDTVSGGTSNKDRAYKYCVDSGRIIAKQVGTTSMKIHFDPLHPSALDEKLA